MTASPSRSSSSTIKRFLSTDRSREVEPLILPLQSEKPMKEDNEQLPTSGLTAAGFNVLLLLAFQNCSKNILLRFVMKEHPKFLTSAAILGVEGVKLVLSLLYIVLIERRPVTSAVTFMRQDRRNSLLMVVPATLYSIQMTLEYVALGNIDAAVFSVLVQTKLLATAACSVFILGKRIRKKQLISLILLMIGVMLCNMKDFGNTESSENSRKGIIATLGISACSGFASVYTEKVIKAKRNINSVADDMLPSHDQPSKEKYGLAYTQVQLAVVSLVIMGFYCAHAERDQILEKGLWYGFNGPAFVSIFVSAIGGLIVAAGKLHSSTSTMIFTNVHHSHFCWIVLSQC
jgi:UDP-sugar transporter A1/2/3